MKLFYRQRVDIINTRIPLDPPFDNFHLEIKLTSYGYDLKFRGIVVMSVDIFERELIIQDELFIRPSNYTLFKKVFKKLTGKKLKKDWSL